MPCPKISGGARAGVVAARSLVALVLGVDLARSRGLRCAQLNDMFDIISNRYPFIVIYDGLSDEKK